MRHMEEVAAAIATVTFGARPASLVVVAPRTELAVVLRHGLDLGLGLQSMGDSGLGSGIEDDNEASFKRTAWSSVASPPCSLASRANAI
jgi:hypothetical protein